MHIAVVILHIVFLGLNRMVLIPSSLRNLGGVIL